ncbi:PEP-CTERM sorting domain-containing protein [Prosthecobacter sp.]|uniref:PEP-CTERM sorting domain-containing protein n=1 Tax=Prosthecobacter sp. TaxID=1965333 RepID=UPI002AB93C6F|nr:PEP-CTERM sorting domain-containing protein [Prosthecobacter sp.]MDZ4404115.1 PEP-CTERM sorting domain-containing protein [Prosthecobacter sp.]
MQRSILLMVALAAGMGHKVATAAVVAVQFNNMFVVGHGSVSSWNGSFSNATMNSRTDILPFTSPVDGATRFGPNHPANAQGNVIASTYTQLDGAGTFVTTSLGTTTSVFGSNRPNYSVQSFANGSRLPIAAASGTLGSALNLPNGTLLNAGTTIYADFSAYVMDYNKPADYWHDTTTSLTHQVYEGGTTSFFYQDGLGQYQLLSSYAGSVMELLNNYSTGSTVINWNGTSTAVNNVLLPATLQFGVFGDNIQDTGILPSELNTSPYLGFFAIASMPFTANFDLDNATLAPEPARLLLLLAGAGCVMLRRKRRLAC